VAAPTEETVDIRPPVQVTHTYTQALEGPPDEVFPLLCPVLEAEWVPGWTAPLVLSDSGVAELDCVFTTPDPAASPEVEAVWTVLQHDEAAGLVEMLRSCTGARPRPTLSSCGVGRLS
jgi:hypothetical protein